MHASRVPLTGTLLGLLLTGVVACDVEDDRLITLEVLGERRSVDGEWLSEEGVREGTVTSDAVVEASDPRLSGDWHVVETCRWGFRAGFVEAEELCVGRVRVENEGGTWLGGHEGYRREGTDDLDVTVLEGKGGYAGLTAVLEYVQDGVTEPGKPIAGTGYIVDFEMPAMPRPAAE